MKIYNLGSLNTDYVYSVDHFVKAKETLGSQKLEIFPGGKGLNQSVALARAGANVYHGAIVGKDGLFLLDVLKSSGVHTEFIKTSDTSGGHAIIQVDQSGQNCILLYAGTNAHIDEEYIDAFLADACEGDILLLQNETSGIDYAIRSAHQKKMKIALNPSPFDSKIHRLPLECITWFFCNEIEAAELFGTEDTEEIISRFKKTYPDAELILTLGELGSIYVGNGKEYRVPIVKVDVVDTTAAGDTFTGYFLSGICRGIGAEAAMKLATKASSIAVSRMGASVSIPYFSEI